MAGILIAAYAPTATMNTATPKAASGRSRLHDEGLPPRVFSATGSGRSDRNHSEIVRSFSPTLPSAGISSVYAQRNLRLTRRPAECAPADANRSLSATWLPAEYAPSVTRIISRIQAAAAHATGSGYGRRCSLAWIISSPPNLGSIESAAERSA